VRGRGAPMTVDATATRRAPGVPADGVGP
jgi:hypothetical protein